MRNLLIGLAAVALIGCGSNNDNNGTNNGTAGTNNGTTAGTNNGTTAGTNNGTTAGTNNGTTTGTNNGTTTGTNNGTTTGTNNGTTAGGPSANCVTYCDLALTNCTADNELYADQAACETACAAFADDGTDCTDPNDCANATAGVQCRVYHASAAAGDAATHCPHASTEGGTVCN